MNDVYIDINYNLSLSMDLWLAALIWVILRIKATLSLSLPPSFLSVSRAFGIFVACVCSMKFFLNSNNWQLIKLHNVQ